MKISFAPLEKDAIELLSSKTGIDFHYASFQPPNWFCATARNNKNAIMGIVAAEWKNSFDVLFNCTVIDRRCMSRRVLRAIFTALFSKAVRVTAEVSVDNGLALNAILRMGFVLEGYCRRGHDGVKDAYVFGMLKEDCVFLRHAGPAPPRPHIPDSVVRNIEAFSQLRSGVGRSADLDDLAPRELGMRRDVVGAGENLVGHILLSGSPPDVSPVDASGADAGRFVSGVFPADWGWAINALADPVVDATHFGATASEVDHGVAKLVRAKRPDNAVIGVAKNGGFKEPLALAPSRHSFQINPKVE